MATTLDDARIMVKEFELEREPENDVEDADEWWETATEDDFEDDGEYEADLKHQMIADM